MEERQDLISRQAAIDALNGIISRFEQILRDIRESKVDDSVCGMCEYDGAFVGQSGDWCNECPGFEKDDCFKLSDVCRKRWLKEANLPSAQPEPLSDAYTKAVWTWLLEYQIKAAELKGRYTPYEVLSWVANDWRKEHEGSD